MQRYVIIVAGGSGTRMGTAIPKQFVEMGGCPVLMHTLRLFAACDGRILVLPAAHRALWEQLCQKHHFTLPVQVVDGGDTRFQSVQNGLALVPQGVLVAVHDAVRPFAGRQVIESAFLTAERTGSAVPVVEVVDSLRQLQGAESSVLDRSSIRAVQTPQVFQSSLLKEAYQTSYTSLFTDDASVWEAAGRTTTLVEGNAENIKLTRPMDLALAEILLAHGPY